MSALTCNCSILGGTTDSRPCPIHDAPAVKRTAACKFCGHKVRIVKATSRQIGRYVNTRQTGEYFVGTCPACQMRDCHHESETVAP